MESIRLFNPDNDLALANGDANYLPPRSARRMATDLAMLPAWYATEGDVIVLPDSDALYYWKKEKYPPLLLPEVRWTTVREPLPHLPIRPWGWNPALVKQLVTMGAASDLLPSPEEMEQIRRLSGRGTAVRLLERLIQDGKSHPLLGESWLCHTEEEVARRVEALSHSLLKAPWSGSGKGLQPAQGSYIPPLSGWCRRTLQQQGGVVVEPMYRKVVDFAMEFHRATPDAPLTFAGYSLFKTDIRGAYAGNLLLSDEEIERELCRYVPLHTLTYVRQTACRLLEEELSPSAYCGYAGIDMMICDDAVDSIFPEYRMHPCVEVNLRMNMGVVSRLLHDRHVEPGHRGAFHISYFSSPEALKEFHRQRLAETPPQYSGQGRLAAGYQSLTPIGRDTQYCAWMQITSF